MGNSKQKKYQRSLSSHISQQRRNEEARTPDKRVSGVNKYFKLTSSTTNINLLLPLLLLVTTLPLPTEGKGRDRKYLNALNNNALSLNNTCLLPRSNYGVHPQLESFSNLPLSKNKNKNKKKIYKEKPKVKEKENIEFDQSDTIKVTNQISRYPNFISAYLDNGGNINAQNSEGLTLLHISVQSFPRVSHVLIDRGADVNSATTNGTTPLHVAIRYQHDLGVALHLIRAGANVNAKTKAGETPLFLAMIYNNKAREILLEAGADPNYIYEGGYTSLHEAVKLKPSNVPVMLKMGMSPNAKTDEGLTVLHIAAREQPSLIDLLLEAGAIVNVRANDGSTPLHYAVPDAVAPLLTAGVDIDATMNDGKTALIIAIEKKMIAVVDILLAANADINLADNDGMTPTHHAVIHCPDLLPRLYYAGASLTLNNNAGQQPLALAIANRSLDAVQFFQNIMLRDNTTFSYPLLYDIAIFLFKNYSLKTMNNIAYVIQMGLLPALIVSCGYGAYRMIAGARAKPPVPTLPEGEFSPNITAKISELKIEELIKVLSKYFDVEISEHDRDELTLKLKECGHVTDKQILLSEFAKSFQNLIGISKATLTPDNTLTIVINRNALPEIRRELYIKQCDNKIIQLEKLIYESSPRYFYELMQQKMFTLNLVYSEAQQFQSLIEKVLEKEMLQINKLLQKAIIIKSAGIDQWLRKTKDLTQRILVKKNTLEKIQIKISENYFNLLLQTMQQQIESFKMKLTQTENNITKGVYREREYKSEDQALKTEYNEIMVKLDKVKKEFLSYQSMLKDEIDKLHELNNELIIALKHESIENKNILEGKVFSPTQTSTEELPPIVEPQVEKNEEVEIEEKESTEDLELKEVEELKPQAPLEPVTEVPKRNEKGKEPVIIIYPRTFFAAPKPATSQAGPSPKVMPLQKTTPVPLDNLLTLAETYCDEIGLIIRTMHENDYGNDTDRHIFHYRLLYNIVRLFVVLQGIGRNKLGRREIFNPNQLTLLRNMLCHLPDKVDINDMVLAATTIQTNVRSLLGTDFTGSELYASLKPLWDREVDHDLTSQNCVEQILNAVNEIELISKAIVHNYELFSSHPDRKDAIKMLFSIIGDYARILREDHYKDLRRFKLDKVTSYSVKVRNSVCHSLQLNDSSDYEVFRHTKTDVERLKNIMTEAKLTMSQEKSNSEFDVNAPEFVFKM